MPPVGFEHMTFWSSFGDFTQCLLLYLQHDRGCWKIVPHNVNKYKSYYLVIENGKFIGLWKRHKLRHNVIQLLDEIICTQDQKIYHINHKVFNGDFSAIRNTQIMLYLQMMQSCFLSFAKFLSWNCVYCAQSLLFMFLSFCTRFVLLGKQSFRSIL